MTHKPRHRDWAYRLSQHLYHTTITSSPSACTTITLPSSSPSPITITTIIPSPSPPLPLHRHPIPVTTISPSLSLPLPHHCHHHPITVSTITLSPSPLPPSPHHFHHRPVTVTSTHHCHHHHLHHHHSLPISHLHPPHHLDQYGPLTLGLSTVNHSLPILSTMMRTQLSNIRIEGPGGQLVWGPTTMILWQPSPHSPHSSPLSPLSPPPGRCSQPAGSIYPDIGSLSKLERNLSAEPSCSSGSVSVDTLKRGNFMINTSKPHPARQEQTLPQHAHEMHKIQSCTGHRAALLAS